MIARVIAVEPFDIVVFGATGDLSQRKLLPALYERDKAGQVPPEARIIGTSRRPLSDDEFRDFARKAILEHIPAAEKSGTVLDDFLARLSYVPVDAMAKKGWADLGKALKDGAERIRIFYLATSPDLFGEICGQLGQHGLVTERSRVVVEKPIGKDLESARELNDAIGKVFPEESTYRIDHYLGKETVQNLIALRFANAFFEPLWNQVSIDHVQITIAETVGAEGRWSYYNEYGALRDMVQNHLLQLVCLVAMEPPASLDPDSVRNEKVKVLRSLRPITTREIERKTVRGQYRAGVTDGGPVPGYLEEAGGGPSDTETFVAIHANIDNWRWAGVPFYLRTGKRLADRRSQIVIQFKNVPHSIFAGDQLKANRLTIRLQPEEEIALSLMNKTPSLDGTQLRPVDLNLSLTDAFRQQAPRRRIAYERLLLEAIRDNQTLFVRRDEAEAAWTWIDAIEEAWRNQAVKPSPYPAGGWGPAGAFALTERNGHSWYE